MDPNANRRSYASEDKIRQLKEVNPNFSDKACINALQRAKGHIQYAAEILFTETSSRNLVNVDRPMQPAQDRSKQPRHVPAVRPKTDHRQLPKARGLEPVRQPSEAALAPAPARDPRSGQMQLNDADDVEPTNPNSYYKPRRARGPPADADMPRLNNPPSPHHKSDLRPSSQQRPSAKASPPPFIPHMSREKIAHLKVGMAIDHRDDVGKSLPSKIIDQLQDGRFVIHYDGWAAKWDTTCDQRKEFWRFSDHKTLSCRKVFRAELKNLGVGDYIDINPRKHPGWKAGTIRRLDVDKKTGKRSSGQVQVQYRAEVQQVEKPNRQKVKEYLYWVHLDNEEEVAPFPTKSQAEYNQPEEEPKSEKIVHNYTKDCWIEVKDVANDWEPATVTKVEGNYIHVHYERWSSKWDEKLHVVRHKHRIRSLGMALPENEQEKLKREELALAKQKLKDIGTELIEMEEDGNCLYRAWAHQIYGDANKFHNQVRKECCDYIEDNKEFFAFWIPDFEDEMKKKRKKGEWGDHVDIMAMSEKYNVPVKIYELDFPRKQLNQTEFGFEKGTEDLPVLLLCRHRQRHYNAVHNSGDKVKLPFSKDDRTGNQLRKNRAALEREERKKEEEEKENVSIDSANRRSRRFSSRWADSRPATRQRDIVPDHHGDDSLRRQSALVPRGITDRTITNNC